MNTTVFVGGTAILADRLLPDARIVCEGETIQSVGSGHDVDLPTGAKVVDCQGQLVAPGYIDLHVHGGLGADFMDGTEEAVRTVCRAHLRHGTTTLFPTSTTGSQAQIMAMIHACQAVSATNNNDTPLPTLPGIHLYGPFFAEDKVGCHSVEGRRAPTAEEFRHYFAYDFVRIATCAAELPGAAEFYQAARQHNCFITCGHSNASWTEMQRAFELGMRHVDHFWCAMSSITSLRQRFGAPMQASMAEFVLMQEEMSTEVIADGWHLSDQLLEFAFRMLGPSRLCLVTDCNRALDMPPGQYRFGNIHDGSWLRSDGRVGWAPDGNSLASSVVGIDFMVRHMFQHTSANAVQAVRMASLTPAERTGIADQTGSLAPGKRADLLLLNSELEVQAVYCCGRRVPDAGQDS